MEEIQDAAMQKQVDAGAMTQAQANQAKAMTSNFTGAAQILGAVISPLFVAGLTPFWGGFIIWLGGVVFGRRLDFMKAVEAAGLPLMIMAVGALVKGLLCAAMGSAFVSIGPALLVKNFDPTNTVHNSLLMIDVFAIWALVLRAVGLAKLTGVSLVKAVAWVFAVWIAIVGTCFGFGLAVQKFAAAMSGQH